MDLAKAARASRFLDEISLSVKRIIYANFPGLTDQEKEEIDQEVKLKILKIAASGKKVRNLRSYVWKMVYTTALDVIDGRILALSLDDCLSSERTPLESFVDTLSPEYLFEEKELLALTSRAIDALPPRRRTAVLMHLQGLSVDETAASLGLSFGAARHLVYRGLDEVKDRIAERAAARPVAARRRRPESETTRLELKRT